MTIKELWQLLAGLGIFLFGMVLLEDSLKNLAGRTFKLFLRKHTKNRLSAIFSGTIVTGVLQSSSVVTLMVLGFVGAGILSMRNALGVVFGSNLGTTLDSWVVASLGFKFSIEDFALPIIAIAGLVLISFPKREKLQHLSKFFIGFGFLFLGLSYMKESFDTLSKNFDFNEYAHLGTLSFVFIGMVLTAAIQSSSATTVIVLSALSTKVIPFEMAVAVIIGAELGSSLKSLLGAIGGIAAKRRVAYGNIAFNIVITVFAYSLMRPLIGLVRDVIGIEDPLIALVMFQTIMNLAGVAIFFPFLNYFADFLEKRFDDTNDRATYFITNDDSSVQETLIETMEKEALLFIYRVMHLNMEAFHLEDEGLIYESGLKKIVESEGKKHKSYADKYNHVKQAEGEILLFYNKVRESKTIKEDLERLTQLTAAVRHAMYAAKGIKDLQQDRKDLRDSADDEKFGQYKVLQEQLREFYKNVYSILNAKASPSVYTELSDLIKQILDEYEKRTKDIYVQSAKETVNEVDISTLLNINREIYSSCKAIIYSLKDYLLDVRQAEELENIPVL